MPIVTDVNSACTAGFKFNKKTIGKTSADRRTMIVIENAMNLDSLTASGRSFTAQQRRAPHSMIRPSRMKSVVWNWLYSNEHRTYIVKHRR
jgi:hypothetical protein